MSLQAESPSVRDERRRSLCTDLNDLYEDVHYGLETVEE
jgi:hypothetical protein